jgi:CheY-like chemotaxis protein
MTDGGALTLRTGWRDIAAGDDPDLAPGRYSLISVTDTGSGMTEEVQRKIFQPFFTTKPKGRGTGLGLATCAVVIKHYAGAIRFDTVPGQGTTFHVLIPHTESPALNLDFDFDVEPGTGTETILIVEDDEPIRNVTSAILRSLGYQIFPFASGSEALEFCSSPGAPQFDLLLSDIVMPNMGGRELAERLAVIRPGLRVLFMSGYVDDPIILQAVQDAAVPFLEKPFTRDLLARKIREAIDVKN